MIHCCPIEAMSHPKLRKGFTLIELVVVIAVIAILSAVSVVSYVAITNKAKQSSDEQAVRQMNTALKASGILGAKDMSELFSALSEEGLDARNYKPLMKDTYFFWDQEDNQIVYAQYKDGKYVGMFPEAYKGKEQGEHHWFSLSGSIQTVKVDSSKISGNTYTLSSAEEVYTVLKDENYKTTTAKEIVLSSNIDMRGADVSFENVTNLSGGTGEAKVIENLSQVSAHTYNASAKEKYACGLFGEVKGKTITISNVVLENSVIGDYSAGHCGLVGAAHNSTITITNVTVRNCSLYSRQKVAPFIGYADNSTITMTNCKAENVDIHAVQGEAGKLIGAAGSGATITETNASVLTNVTIQRGPNHSEVKLTSAIEDSTVTLNGVKPSNCYLVCGDDDKGDGPSGKDIYRFFNENAIMTIVWNTKVAGSKATYNGTLYAIGGITDDNRTQIVHIGSTEYVIKGSLPLVL